MTSIGTERALADGIVAGGGQAHALTADLTDAQAAGAAVGDGYGFDHYRALTERVQQLPAPATTALRNSLVFATAATARPLLFI